MLEKMKDTASKLGLFNFLRRYFRKPIAHYRNYFFKKDSCKALKFFLNVLEEEKIPYWIEFGTLLGCIREGKILEHDLDIDFAVLGDIEYNYEEKFKKNGFTKKSLVRLDGKIIQETYLLTKNRHVSIDIYRFFKTENGMIFYESHKEDGLSYSESFKKYGGKLVSLKTFPKYGTMKAKIHDLEVNIPKLYEKHLTILYGKDYLVPNKNWEEKFEKEKILKGKIATVGN